MSEIAPKKCGRGLQSAGRDGTTAVVGQLSQWPVFGQIATHWWIKKMVKEMESPALARCLLVGNTTPRGYPVPGPQSWVGRISSAAVAS
jgi:hypothetical protein